MSDLIRSGYVNWVDGMKMSKAHFLQLQQAVEDRIRDARMLQDPFADHGLLGPGPEGESPLDLSITLEGRTRYQIELRQCRAMTPAGDRIELLHTHEPIRVTGEIPEQMIADGNQFDVILRTTPSISDAFGTPDPAESPARHPFVRPVWTIEVSPVNELKQGAHVRNHLAIARLYVAKDELEQDNGHIPPAMCMAALPQLQEFIREYTKFLKDIERDLIRIVIKLNVLKDLTELQMMVDGYCRSGLRFLESGMAPILLAGANARPREVVLHASQFARTLHHAVELLTSRGKDGLLDYMREHTGIKPAEHVATVTGLMDRNYDHTDLRGALGTVTLFCRTHKKLMDMWVGLDYIGQKRDKDIFIAQDAPIIPRTAPPKPSAPAPKTQKPSSGWDF